MPRMSRVALSDVSEFLKAILMSDEYPVDNIHLCCVDRYPNIPSISCPSGLYHILKSPKDEPMSSKARNLLSGIVKTEENKSDRKTTMHPLCFWYIREDGQMGGPTDGRTDWQTNWWTNGQPLCNVYDMYLPLFDQIYHFTAILALWGRTHGRSDKASYGDAWMHLKRRTDKTRGI